METKKCSGCKQEKAKAEFYRNRSARDGLNGYCKACWKVKIDAAITSGRHAKYCRKTQAMYRADPVKRAAMVERVREARRNGKCLGDREKNRARTKAHYEAHKEEYVCRVSARKARLLGSGGSHSSEAWRQMLALFSNRCLCCGATERITKDHIVPVARGGTDDILNLQPLCLSCNKRKFTCDKDFRTRDKVVLLELNAVGKLLFLGRVGKQEIKRLQKHKPASRYTGVQYAPKSENSVKVWRALIRVNGKVIHLGRHATEEAAAEAYNAAARKYVGDSAFVNELNRSHTERADDP